MIKKTKSLLIVLLLVMSVKTLVAANLVEMIKQMNEDNLKGYVQPLITSFGIATSSGLYHTAATHGLLGFDLDLQFMWVPIPESAKTFVAKVLKISPTGTTSEDVVTPTIFGKSGVDTISVPSGSALPPVLPGGFNLPGIPFFMPQLNVGLIQGTEVMIRYMPMPFKGSTVQIFGAGFKIGLNDLLNLKLMPINIAVQGAYQVFNIGDIIKSTTINANIHASKTFLLVTPYVGVGYENTKVNFDYTLPYDVPLPYEKNVKLSINGENNFRAVAGLSLNLGLIRVHGDFNLCKYPSFNGGIGIGLR